MGCGSSHVPVDTNIQMCKVMLKRQVDCSRFSGNGRTDYNKFWSSEVYGGSVLEPIGEVNSQEAVKAARRTKKNMLDELISKAEVNYLYGGGYYCLRDVIVEEQYYKGEVYCGKLKADIYLLIEKHDDIKKLDQLKFLSDSAEIARTSPMLLPKGKNEPAILKPVARESASRSTKNVTWAELISVLNGYGRIVTYTENEEAQLETVREGFFKNGMLDDFGRFYDLSEESNSHLDIGFFTED